MDLTYVDACNAFFALQAQLRALRAANYPPGAKVQVVCPQFTGLGTIVADTQCPLDKVSVRLENDNVWWYPASACTVFH